MESNHKLEDSMKDSELTLDVFAKQFKAWRGDRRHVPYPKQFWENIHQLSKKYSIHDIAQALEINASFLRDRLRNKPHKFAPVHLKTFYSIATLEFFTVLSERPIVVRFQSDHEQLVQLILALSSHKP